MTNAQIIRAPNGDEMVVLPRADYDALIAALPSANEDDDDIALFDARMAEIEAGRTALLPAEVSDMMLRGKRLLVAIRRWRGLTQEAAAQACGVSQGYLSDMETGKKPIHEDAAKKLAQCYDVPSTWLI